MKEMLCFGCGFTPSTLLLLLLLLSTADAGDDEELCKNEQYNPDVFNATPIQQLIEDRVCNNNCSAYVCKIDTTLYFGHGCLDDVINFCKPDMEAFERNDSTYAFGKFVARSNEMSYVYDSYGLYQKYMEQVKPFGNDSMQERFLWFEAFFELDVIVTDKDQKIWAEKALAYIPMNLQNFKKKIQNADMIVKTNVEDKALDLQMAIKSLFHDLQDVQKAANHSLPENEYFQKKYVEMEAKMEVIKKNDNTLKSYMIKSNETLHNVEMEMNNAQKETNTSINALPKNVGLDMYDSMEDIQASILQKVSSTEAKVLDLIKFANRTLENYYSVSDDDIGYFQSAGYEARKAMKDYENEKEMKDLMKEIKDAVKDVKKIGEAAQKTVEKAQAIVDESKYAEALHSNGRKSGGFEVSLILSFLILLFI